MGKDASVPVIPRQRPRILFVVQQVGEASGASVEQRRDGDQPVVAARKMRPRARPSPVLRSFDKARTHRVQRAIARRRHQVRFVHHDRGEASLKQMARHPQPCVDERRIAPMRLAQRPSEPLGRPWRQNQMDVIGHQAIAPNSDPLAPACLAQQIAIERIIVLTEEHGPAPIAALGDVMRQVRDDETADARHERGPPGCDDVHRVLWGKMQVSP
jgi:hypothetical protein